MKIASKLVPFVSSVLLYLCLIAPASAISVAVVGSLDDFLDSALLSKSGQGEEESWVSTVLGFAAKINYKIDPVPLAGWQLVSDSTDSDHWAYSLTTEPAHYVLKLGVGQSGADTHYLFENIAALSWAVIDLSELLDGQNLDFNFGRVSHISEIDGGTTVSLREPGTIGLLILGLGLVSVIIARKSKSS